MCKGLGWKSVCLNLSVYKEKQKRWGWWLFCLFFLSWKQQACHHWYSLCLPEDLLVVLQAASCEFSPLNWEGGDTESLTKVSFFQVSINCAWLKIILENLTGNYFFSLLNCSTPILLRCGFFRSSKLSELMGCNFWGN